jgi:cytochrome c553
VSALIGGIVVVSGLVPVDASSGHWGITKQFLNFAKQRSVATHSGGIEVPSLDDDDMVLKGAGHYETSCRFCHGSPAHPASPVALSMTATPPLLIPRLAQYEPQELFYIVKHGIKFTGMPAWPAQQRDDEVWAMVAFLLELPELDARQYHELTDATSPETPLQIDSSLSSSLMESCYRCHGHDGLGRGTGAFPKLAGQNPGYLYQSMQMYANGNRHSGIMQPVAAVLDDDQLQELADHFSKLPAGLEASSSKIAAKDEDNSRISRERGESIKRGRSIAQDGIPDRNVPACIDCHGPNDLFVADSYPLLSGQYAGYIVLQLKLIQSNHRGGTNQLELMRPVVEGMTEQNFEDVAAYYSSLSSEE